MKPILLALLAITALPLAPTATATAVIDPRPVCVFDPYLWDQNIGNVCVDVDFSPLCIQAWGGVNSQHVYYVVSTPGTSATTKPIDAGPVHVSAITVTVDPVHVGTIDLTTPGRGFTNEFCTTELVG